MVRRTIIAMLALIIVGVGVLTAAEPREDLVDLLVSDQIERLDFVATTFDGAMSRVEQVADLVLARGVETFETPDETAAVCGQIIESLNSFRPRTEGYVFGELTLVILDEDDAESLAELIVTAAEIVNGDPVARNTVRPSIERLMRGVVIDIEAGVPPLEQLLEHVRSVAALPADERVKFLR